jgi:hypothetical protein
MRIAILACLGLLAGTGMAAAQDLTPASPSVMTGVPGAGLPLRTMADLDAACAAANGNSMDIDTGFQQKQATCSGYTEGVVDAYLSMTAQQPAMRQVCLPNPAPQRGALVQQLVTWYNANPRDATEPAAPAVLQFFMATYPCQKG